MYEAGRRGLGEASDVGVREDDRLGSFRKESAGGKQNGEMERQWGCWFEWWVLIWCSVVSCRGRVGTGIARRNISPSLL